MNDIVNTFLLAGDKSMPEMNSKQPGLTDSACRPFTKNEEKIQKWLQKYKMKMYSKCNDEKSVVAEKFIGTLEKQDL